MTILGATITAMAARRQAADVELRAATDDRTIYRVWCGRQPLGSVWRQTNGRWCALSYESRRMKLNFGTALQAACWIV